MISGVKSVMSGYENRAQRPRCKSIEKWYSMRMNIL
jgi:hypothetical protein